MEKLTVVLTLVVAIATAEMRKAIVHLQQPNTSYRGNVTFEQSMDGGNVTIKGIIEGLNPDKHGFHIHQLGDISVCDNAGSHFNPENKSHGGPGSDERHVGDLGNIIAGENGVAVINQVDNKITLFGANSIIGRSLVVHEKEDDLGKADTPESKKTGTAGRRLVCGVIGIQSPATAWFDASSSSHTSALSLGIVTVIAALLTKL